MPGSTSVISSRDDAQTLTTFGNPFPEDDHENVSFALVSTLLSKVKNTFTSNQGTSSSSTAQTTNTSNRPSHHPLPHPSSSSSSNPSSSNILPKVKDHIGSQNAPARPTLMSKPLQRVQSTSARERPSALAASRKPAPPIVSMTPVISEIPTYIPDTANIPSSRSVDLSNYSPIEGGESLFNTIPGFPIQDDTRSIRTVASVKRGGSASKVIRRLRGDGLSKDYWMDDELCKECYDCKSVFTAWRRKHHCRICGQIYCSRCASNILKGSRFGQDGLVRVCNICLKMLEDDTYDDDDDHRSVASAASFSFPAHQLESVQSAFPASNIAPSSIDPYSLFSIPEGGFHPQRRVAFGGQSDIPSSYNFDDGDDDPTWSTQEIDAAPFRRHFHDEDKDLVLGEEYDIAADRPDESTVPAIASIPLLPPPQPPTPATEASLTPSLRNSASFVFPTISDNKESFISFPTSPDPYNLDSPQPLRSRVSSFATDGDVLGHGSAAPPFLRSRVHSRLTGIELGEPGWRTRRESSAYAAELNGISMFHLRVMLRQLLSKENIPRIKEWEEILLKLSLRVASRLTVNPRAPGASMDIRNYVKIKKIPGGAPRDSEYVDGAVITKNVAHKNMSREIRNPRIMLVTFPFDYHRVEGQFMSLDPLLAQERDYLHNLVSRVAALRPHIILVERSVSRLALEKLLEQNIAVARTVKNKALQFVSRATQAQILTSIDRLVTEPQMGQCARFRVQTFEHPLIPGRRKTYMRFEGCSHHDTACTIILRGEDLETLKKIKEVTRFMMFVVRNLKMETFLWKDTVVSMPAMTTDAMPMAYHSPGEPRGAPIVVSAAGTKPPMTDQHPILSTDSLFAPIHSSPLDQLSFPASDDAESSDAELSAGDLAKRNLSKRIQASLEPYKSNFISASATLRFPPPYPIWKMQVLDDQVHALQKAKDDDEAAQILHDEELSQLRRQHQSSLSSWVQPTTFPFESNEGANNADGPSSPDLPRTPMPRDAASLAADMTNVATTASPAAQTLRRVTSRSSVLSTQSSAASSVTGGRASIYSNLTQPKPIDLVDVSKIQSESALVKARYEHEEQRRVWEWYLRKNADDFVVQKYQCIYVRQFIVPNVTMDLEPACFMPKLVRIEYYGQEDCTLGQFIEDSVLEALDSKKLCTGKGCRKHLNAHSRVYVHNETRVIVATGFWRPPSSDSPISLPSDKVASYSICRICEKATPCIIPTDETLKYSFGKFLELMFYPAEVMLMHGAGCEHNIYLHHTRYFTWRGMTVRFQAEPVEIYETVFPPLRTKVDLESLLELKNHDYINLLSRMTAYWKSVVARIIQMQMQCKGESPPLEERGSTPNPLADAVTELLYRAEADRSEFLRSIRQAYQDSPPTDTLALGLVRSSIQNKVVQWDGEIERFEKAFMPVKNRIPSEKDLRRMTGSHHFRRIYDDFFRSNGSSASEIDERSDTYRDSVAPLSEVESATESAVEGGMDAVSDAEPSSTVDSATSIHEVLSSDMPITPSSDGDASDSTIGASRKTDGEPTVIADEGAISPITELPNIPVIPVDQPKTISQPSRLPRWNGSAPIVSDLVRHFQSTSGLTSPPGPSEASTGLVSDADVPPESVAKRRPRMKSNNDGPNPPADRNSLISDFEYSYAANIAPRYITHSRRPLGKAHSTSVISRIPAPASKSPTAGLEGIIEPSPQKQSASGKQPRASGSNQHADDGPSRNDPTAHIPRIKSKSSVRPTARLTSRTVTSPMVPPRPSYGPRTTSRVSNLARQFERMSKDSTRRYAVMRGRKARPVATARAKVEVFSDIRDVVMDESEEDINTSSSEADDEDDGDEDSRKIPSPEAINNPPKSVPTEPEAPSAEAELADSPSSPTPVDPPKLGQDISAVPITSPTEDYVPPSSPPLSTPDSPDARIAGEFFPHMFPEQGREGSTVINVVSAWWRSSNNVVPLQYPFGTAEHMFADNPITIREDEPTSIIAFTLKSKDHRNAMYRSRAERNTRNSDKPEAFMPDDGSDTRSTWGVISLDEAPDPAEMSRLPLSVTHLSFQFESGGVGISCVVFCAEQFEALRKSCDCDDTVIESLARCLKWDASGGKSGSAFLKTRDERFIAKELSKSELDAMIKFAPAYFDYMSNAMLSNRPTLLAKIFGFYKIAYKNPMLGKTVRMNLLVMENLFYGRRFSRIYDLKGSMRNRHVQSTGRENEVLLDENLVRSSHLQPFYVREHSKRILRGALWNDSQFLADLNIMDYSVLVAVDSGKKELVLGIVDYIRTYTWDKVLETWVKETALLGNAAKGEPTIITPKQYKARFRSAMERYFPLVPDRWTKQKDEPDNNGDNLLDMWADW